MNFQVSLVLDMVGHRRLSNEEKNLTNKTNNFCLSHTLFTVRLSKIIQQMKQALSLEFNISLLMKRLLF